MRTRRKVLGLVACFFGGGLTFLALALRVHEAFLWGVFAVTTTVAFLLRSLRCPNCGERLWIRRLRPWPFPIYVVPLSRRCSHCAQPLP